MSHLQQNKESNGVIVNGRTCPEFVFFLMYLMVFKDREKLVQITLQIHTTQLAKYTWQQVEPTLPANTGNSARKLTVGSSGSSMEVRSREGWGDACAQIYGGWGGGCLQHEKERN